MASRGRGAIVNVSTMAATLGIEFMGEALDQLAAQGPAGRVADPAEIAYLATDAASFVHGTPLAVDGGRTAV